MLKQRLFLAVTGRGQTFNGLVSNMNLRLQTNEHMLEKHLGCLVQTK